MTEKDIQNVILQYLNIRGIYCWPNQSVGIWDQHKKIYRKPNNKYHLNGVSDILGILPGGRQLAIEVKTPKNKVRPQHQVEFIDAVNRKGGLAFFATSVNDVIEKLNGAESKANGQQNFDRLLS